MDEEEDKKKEKLIIKKFKKKKIRIAIHMRRSNIFFNIISRKGNTLQQFSCANFDIHNSKKRKNIIRYDIAYAFGMKLKEAGIKKVKPSFTNRSRGYRRILKAFKRTKLKFSAKHFRIKKYKPHNGCPKKMRKRKHRSIKKRKLRFKTRKLRKKKRRRLKKFRLALGEEIKKDKKNNVILGNYLNYLNLLRNARSITAAKKKRYYIMAIRKKAGLFSIHKLKRIARKKKKTKIYFFSSKNITFLFFI